MQSQVSTLRTILAAILLTIVSVLTSVTANAQGVESYIVQIRAEQCPSEDSVQTGFLVSNESILISDQNSSLNRIDEGAILTALHGVAGCDNIYAIASEMSKTAELIDVVFDNLEVSLVDINHDTALLRSKLEADIKTPIPDTLGIKVSRSIPESTSEIWVLGHPYAIDHVIDTKQIAIRNRQLMELRQYFLTHSAAAIIALEQRKSPRLDIQVLNLEGNLVPGLSGAPVLLRADDIAFGIANGGIRREANNGYTWAIPLRDILLIDSRPFEEQLEKLGEREVPSFFSVSSLGKPKTFPLEVVLGAGNGELEVFKTEILKNLPSRYFLNIGRTFAEEPTMVQLRFPIGGEVIGYGEFGEPLSFLLNNIFSYAKVDFFNGMLLLDVVPIETTNTTPIIYTVRVVDSETETEISDVLVNVRSKDTLHFRIQPEITDGHGKATFLLPSNLHKDDGGISVRADDYVTKPERPVILKHEHGEQFGLESLPFCNGYRVRTKDNPSHIAGALYGWQDFNIALMALNNEVCNQDPNYDCVSKNDIGEYALKPGSCIYTPSFGEINEYVERNSQEVFSSDITAAHLNDTNAKTQIIHNGVETQYAPDFEVESSEATVETLCPNTDIRITSPKLNETISGFTRIEGTANHSNLNYYKIEYSQSGKEYVYFGGGGMPVINGILDELVTQELPNGHYTLRLTVVDNTGNFPNPCAIPVSIQN